MIWLFRWYVHLDSLSIVYNHKIVLKSISNWYFQQLMTVQVSPAENIFYGTTLQFMACLHFRAKLAVCVSFYHYWVIWRYFLQIVNDIKQDAASVNRCRKLHQYRQIINFLKAKTNGSHPCEIISITQPWRWGDKL